MIYPVFLDKEEHAADDSSGTVRPFQEGLYLTDGKYTLVVQPEIFQGTISMADSPAYLTDYYKTASFPLACIKSDSGRLFDSAIALWENTEELAKYYKVPKVEVNINEIDNTITIEEIAVTESKRETVGVTKFCSTSIFPFSHEWNLGYYFSSFAVTDYYQCSHNRVFPRRMVGVSLKSDPNEKIRYETHEYIVTKFDPDTIPTDADFLIPIPEGVGISDGHEGHASIYSEYGPDWQVISPTKLSELYQLIQSETQKRNETAQATH
ncbi:MAG: hypothetical protein Q4G68_14065 [Planctomycetia bacterium]|nr:hypothetical protein [Planctomycetia bacterium]